MAGNNLAWMRSGKPLSDFTFSSLLDAASTNPASTESPDSERYSLTVLTIHNDIPASTPMKFVCSGSGGQRLLDQFTYDYIT
jgi:hypothetical protein